MERPKAEWKKLPDKLKLSDFSEQSREVLEYFGLEAPHRLNEYCIALEDAVIEQVAKTEQLGEQIKKLQALLEEHRITYK